ncbi:MAG: alpha/beta fold hydrolase [Schwartzia sp.]|nr:alpha/beta fold hydrolase [Schwartzia sp. (in: firmicutes)]
MEKHFDINEQGLSIRCKLYFDKDIHAVDRVVISTHGFGGNKENRSAEKFAERLTSKYKNYGVICFDWPCHGDDARKKLVLDECMTYLTLVIEYAKKEFNTEDIYLYATSFGGYLGLKYIAEIGNPFRKIALRAPGTDMYEIMGHNISEPDRVKLEKGKEILVGFDRKMKIDKDFMEGLKTSDVRNYEYFDYADDIIIIHGTKDEKVPFEDSVSFAEKNVIELIPVENGDHILTNPKSMDFAIHTIIGFFAPEE